MFRFFTKSDHEIELEIVRIAIENFKSELHYFPEGSNGSPYICYALSGSYWDMANRRNFFSRIFLSRYDILTKLGGMRDSIMMKIFPWHTINSYEIEVMGRIVSSGKDRLQMLESTRFLMELRGMSFEKAFSVEFETMYATIEEQNKSEPLSQ